MTEIEGVTGRGRIALKVGTVALVGLLAFSLAPRTVSNQALLASETPAAELLRAIAETPAGEPVEVDWRTLAGLNYESGEMTDVLRELNGREIKIPGFMVPLEDFAEQVSEFLLVPYFGACIHTPPPPPNQIVHVHMDGNRKAKVEWWEPIWIEGTLAIEDIESIYGVSGYQLVGMNISPYSE